jgi:fluoride exporter
VPARRRDGELLVDSSLPPLRSVGLVFLGGAIGAVSRVAFATWFPTQPGAYPWTTFFENVVGAFLLALVLTVLAMPSQPTPRVQLLVGTGVLGAFTTYSTFAVELERLLDGGVPGVAAAYAGASLVTGVLAAAVGIALGRGIAGRWRDPDGGGPT